VRSVGDCPRAVGTSSVGARVREMTSQWYETRFSVSEHGQTSLTVPPFVGDLDFFNGPGVIFGFCRCANDFFVLGCYGVYDKKRHIGDCPPNRPKTIPKLRLRLPPSNVGQNVGHPCYYKVAMISSGMSKFA
jgi:hypothetical protein